MAEPETIVKKWIVYCIEEAITVTVWSDEVPTLCPNDHTDRSIDHNKTRQISFLSTKKFKVEDSFTGYFQATSIEVNVPAGYPGDTYEFDFIYPMDLQVLKLGLFATNNMVGDEISGANRPQTLVGQLTQTTPYGSKVFSIPGLLASSTDFLKGMELRVALLLNPTIYEDVGRIIEIDRVNYTCTSEFPVSQDFPIGSLIYLTVYTIRDFFVSKGDQYYSFGTKGLGARDVPANALNRWYHTNNNGQAKTYHIDLEFYHM